MFKAIVSAASLCLLAGCSVSSDVHTAEGEIAHFHKQLDAGQFADIYSASSPEFQKVTTSDAWSQLLAAIHRKLGAFQSGKTAGWGDNATLRGHFVTINYAARYARGPAQETFVYKSDGDHLSLVGYHVNSTALILN
jgi:hypothetical protein